MDSQCLARAGHHMDVYTRRDAASLPAAMDVRPGFRVLHLDAGPPAPVPKETLLPHMGEFTRGAVQLFRHGHRYDVVHANFFMSALAGLRLRTTFGVPLVVTFHALGLVRRRHQGDADGFPDERITIEREVVRRADRIVGECPQDLDDLVHLNERDEIGSDLVPDYLTCVTDGAFYGWPYSYYGSHVDTRVQPPKPDLVARAKVPDYALGAHVAALGLAWSAGANLGAAFGEGMYSGEHGSWNRRPPSGDKVVFVPFAEGRPQGMPVDVLTAFVGPDGNARGRPVAVVVDGRGALLVADDVGNTVWRVFKP